MGAKPSTTLLDKTLNGFKNHPRWSAVIFVGVVIVAIGGVAGALNEIVGLRELLPGHDKERDSTTVAYPPGVTFRQAILMLAEDSKGVANFGKECPARLLEAVIRPTSYRAATTLEHMESLRYMLPPRSRTIEYKVHYHQSRGVYEISCEN